MREELAAERKHFSGLVSQESELRMQAEGREAMLAQEVRHVDSEIDSEKDR